MTTSQEGKKPELSALLIGNNTVPKGCQVINVSQQGMTLQCEPDGRLLTFRNGDAVEIYLTAHHTNGHNKFTIPAVVSHVDESIIDLVFHCTDTELAELIESYRTSGTHTLEASLDYRQKDKTGLASDTASFEEIDSYAASPPLPSHSGGYKFLIFGLPSLLLASIVFMGAYIFSSSITDRLNALETATKINTNDLGMMQTQVGGSPMQEMKYDSLNVRIVGLTEAFKRVENKLNLALLNKPAIADDLAATQVDAGSAGISGESTGASTRASDKITLVATASPANSRKAPAGRIAEPPAVVAAAPVKIRAAKILEDKILRTPPQDTEPALTTPIERKPAQSTAPVGKIKPATTAGQGPWVINLLSSPVKSYVDKSASRALDKGINVVQTRATVNGREYWRLQITGFQSRAAAQSFAEPVRKQLALKDIWIFKRTR